MRRLTLLVALLLAMPTAASATQHTDLSVEAACVGGYPGFTVHTQIGPEGYVLVTQEGGSVDWPVPIYYDFGDPGDTVTLTRTDLPDSVVSISAEGQTVDVVTPFKCVGRDDNRPVVRRPNR